MPTLEWLMRHMRSGGLITVGIIIGGALFMALYSHNFSLLYMENQQLKTERDDLIKTLEPYQKNKNRTSIIHQLKINLSPPPGLDPPDQISSLQLKRQIVNDLDTLRGKPVDSAAESMIIAKRIMERKVYRLEKDQEYQIEFQLILIRSGELIIWTEVRPYIRSD